MSKYIITRQIVKNIYSIRFLTIILISFILIFIQYWTTYHTSFILYEHDPTFLSDVMLFSQYGSGSTLYLFMMPLLAAMLGGSLIAQERHWGRLPEIVVRVGREQVLRSSLMSSFVLGGIGGTLPLVLNMAAAGVSNPHMSYIEGTEWTSEGVYLNRYVLISSQSWLYPLYEWNQWLCIIFVTALIFILSGLYSNLALASSLFIRRPYIELLVPFCFCLAWWMMPSTPSQWSPIIFLFFSPPTVDAVRVQNWVGMIMTLTILFACTLALCLIKEYRDVD